MESNKSTLSTTQMTSRKFLKDTYADFRRWQNQAGPNVPVGYDGYAAVSAQALQAKTGLFVHSVGAWHERLTRASWEILRTGQPFSALVNLRRCRNPKHFRPSGQAEKKRRKENIVRKRGWCRRF